MSTQPLLTGAEGPEGGSLSQEAAQQLTQAQLSMGQLAHGSNRLQACR